MYLRTGIAWNSLDNNLEIEYTCIVNGRAIFMNKLDVDIGDRV